jgi:hypothetical protein
MRKVFITISAIIVAMLMQASSCKQDPKTVPTECGDIACTMMFGMITVEVKDQQGNKVILDEYYTVREKTGDKIIGQSHIPDSGTYTILDDNYTSALRNKTEIFQFIGKKNGTEVINEKYEISADCCHINKVSGKSSITIP